jgi:hypothetical protein
MRALCEKQLADGCQMLITLLGVVVGGFLGFGVFGGGWGVRGKSHARTGSAYGGFFGGAAAMPMLANGLFWVDEAQITQGVVGLLFWPAALAGSGAGIGWIMDRNRAAQAPPQDAKLPPHKTAMAGEGLSQGPSATDDAYDIAGRELQIGAKHAGAWARAVVEADGDPARTEVAYVRLRVAALEAIAREDVARRMEAEAERNALEAEAERAALEAEVERKAKENNVSRFEAELTLLARNAIARRGQYDSAKIHEVKNLAYYIRASYDSAEDLARWEIYRSGTGYRFQGKFYARLTGAVGAARAQADEKASNLGTVRAPSGAAPQGGAAPTASDDQPPFRWDDFR